MPKRDSIGYISITNEGTVSFSFKDFYIEIIASKQSKTIKSVMRQTGKNIYNSNYGGHKKKMGSPWAK